ncbi:MAG TPA: metallophosphoesterase [Bacillales bacterium]|nr:metallophosphoesterase [Bacillales bacterium]
MATHKWIPLTILFIFFFLFGSYPHVHSEAESTLDTDTVQLRLMETTDLHARILPFSYKTTQPSNTYGLALTASLIRQARSEAKNSMLFDDGDALKGSLLGEYVIAKGLKQGEVHPVYRAMNTLGYDAASIGNHEFNLGLSLLNKSLQGASFPFVNANVYYDDHDDNPDNDRHYFTPYLILPRTFVDENGHERTIKIGVIGFVVPQAIQWNKKYEDLEGVLKVKDIYETAKKYVPIMKENGADIIIALSHSGLGTPKIQYMEQNASYDLTKIDGIDAILFGHVHKVFPSREFAGLPNVNLKKGTVNGVPAVEAGRWGNFLGIIDLSLKKTELGWEVADSHSTVRPVYNPFTKKATVAPDPQVLDAIHEAHEETLNFLLTPEGALLKAR